MGGYNFQFIKQQTPFLRRARISLVNGIYTQHVVFPLCSFYFRKRRVGCNALQLLSLHTLPAVSLGNHLGRALANGEDGEHGVDGGHLGEDTGVGDTHALQTAHLELVVDDGKLVLLDVSHLCGAGRVVDGVGDAAAVLGQLLVALALGAGGDFTLDPVFEGGLLGDLAGGLEAGDDGGGVVAFWVGEVLEVEGGLDGGIGGGQEEAAAGARAGNVGGHAEGVDGAVVAETVKGVSFCSFVGTYSLRMAYRAVFKQKGIW